MHYRKPLLILLFFAVLAPSALLAAGDRPMRLSDIRKVLRDGKDVEATLVEMSRRGIDFRLDRASEKHLRSWGFDDGQIRQVARIEAGMKIEPPDERGGKKQDDKAGAPKAGGKFPLGHAHDEDATAAIQKRLARALKAANLGYKLHKLDRVTLYCSDRRAEELLASVKQTEKALVAKLPACLSSATGPGTTLLVVADNQKDAHKFDKMLVASYRVDFPGYEKNQPHGGDWAYRMRQNTSIIDFSTYKEPEDLGRLMAFAIGYMVAEQISDGRCAFPISAGFGDLVEQLSYGSPSFVFGQDSGGHKDRIEDWGAFVKDRAKRKRLFGVKTVIEFPYDKMRDEQYAQAWSLTTFLASKPLKLHEYLFRMRSATTKDIAVLAKVYELDLAGLQSAWIKHIADNH